MDVQQAIRKVITETHFMFHQFSESHTRLLGISARFLGNEAILVNFVAIQDLVCSS